MQEGSAIRIHHLSKQYRVVEREAGLRAALRSMVHRTTREVIAHVLFSSIFYDQMEAGAMNAEDT